MVDLLGDEAKRTLLGPKHLEFTEEEVEARRESGLLNGITPYWGDTLRHDDAARFDLMQRLLKVCVGTLRRLIKARMSFFS